jgi:hypothetical protein
MGEGVAFAGDSIQHGAVNFSEITNGKSTLIEELATM